MGEISPGGQDSDEFRADLNAYRRLRYKLAECASAGALDETLLDEIVLAEDRLMSAVATSILVVLTKFEIATSDLPLLNHSWVNTIRADLMQLARLDASPLGTPLI